MIRMQYQVGDRRNSSPTSKVGDKLRPLHTSKWKYVSSSKNNITISKLSSKKTCDLKTRAYKKVEVR